MKQYVPIILVVSASLLLYNSFPTEVTIILSLILIDLLFTKWDAIKSNFS